MKKPTIKEEVKFEGVMEKKPDNTITLKEVYTDLVATKTLLGEMQKKNKSTDKKFTWFATLVVIIEIINLAFNYFIYVGGTQYEQGEKVLREIYQNDQER